MREIDLTVLVLQQIRHRPLQYARRSSRKPSGMFAAAYAETTGLDANHLDWFVIQKGVKEAYGIAASAHAGDEHIRQPTLRGKNLLTRFLADDGLKIADHHRIGMRAKHGAENVVGGPDVRDRKSTRLNSSHPSISYAVFCLKK